MNLNFFGPNTPRNEKNQPEKIMRGEVVTIYAPVNLTAPCIIFSGGQIHYEGG